MERQIRMAFALAGVLFPGAATATWAQAPVKVGEVRAYHAESPHPYPVGNEARPVVWTDRVVSPGALFVRVHFTGLHLAPGDYLTVSEPDGRQVWRYRGRGPHGTGEVWAFAVEGDTAIVRLHGGRTIGHGYRIDAVGHGTERLEPVPEVVCGTSGFEDVACHIHEKGFDEAQAPVARLLYASGGFLFLCTGWLVDGSVPDLLITNNHCIDMPREVESLQASFNLQWSRCGGRGHLGPIADYAGGSLLRTNSISRRGRTDGLDYTLLTLLGNPEASWGEIVPTTRAVAVGEPIWFIQHPGGRPKQVGYWEDADQTVRCKVDAIDLTLFQTAPGSQMGYACDSEGGSSGSPILDAATGRAIGLHHFGGIASDPCLNGGTHMRDVCADAGALLHCAAD